MTGPAFHRRHDGRRSGADACVVIVIADFPPMQYRDGLDRAQPCPGGSRGRPIIGQYSIARPVGRHAARGRVPKFLGAVASLLLGAAGPPPAAPAQDKAVTPEQWNIITSLPDGSCLAKLPPGAGVDFNVMLAPNNTIRIILSKGDWKNETRPYEVIMRLDDFQPFGFSMVGRGAGLAGAIPPEFRAEFMTAGTINFGFNGADYTIRVHDMAGVVARLDTCVAARRASAAR